MKTRILVLIFSLSAVISLSGCYTEFASTRDDYGSSGYSPNYYDSSNSGYAYDTTGAPIINNYNYYGYGYGYPYDYGMYDNFYTPSSWWWQSDLWLGFGWGLNSWYTGYYGSPYGYGGYYGYPHYHSPFYPYGPTYVYQNGGSPTGRVRTIGNTREGRESYGGGSAPVPYVPSTSGGSVYGGATTRGGTSTSVQPSAGTRTRTTSTTNGSSPQSTGNAQPAQQPRVRSGDNSSAPSTNSQPQSAPQQPQPRVRDTGSSGSSSGGNNNQGSSNNNGGRSRRNGNMSYRMQGRPAQVRYFRAQPPNRSVQAVPARGVEQRYYQPAASRPVYSQPRVESAPRSSSVRESAPARSGSSGGGRSRR